MDDLEREFRNPGNAYRGKPFWSWNGVLEQDELLRQVDVMEKMGLGGFFMHSRTGLVTEYLGEEWFRLTNACADDAEARGLEAWLYDEDRWPSGTAGGAVTENPAFRSKFISLRPIPGAKFSWNDDLTAAFTVAELDGVRAAGIHRITRDTPASEIAPWTILAFTIEESSKSSFYNGFTYVDTMNRAATDDYIKRTHEKYRAHCGERLGKSIKGIFTDEPHRGPVMCGFSIGNENRLWMTPWAPTLFAEFERRFGYDLVDRLPDLFLIVDGHDVSPVKWAYMELTQQLFLENYARPLYDWCEKNDMRLTGHVLHEDSLTAQACMQGSLMRFYEHMHYPGVDLLTEGNRCYWIVKQLTSAARQLGQTWLLSELYGCTGWQMDLEAHKAVGDWQALFGINLRCHHLSWYTMGGEAKRDYPASILHQSAWWREYDFVETYFARLGVLLTRGLPCCDLLVLNPIESVWSRIHAGWAHNLSSNVPEIVALETAYRDVFHYLAGAQIDFDYGDEEMLGRLASIEPATDGCPTVLRVGQATYLTVLVPHMTTIRASTLALLDAFAVAGGKVVFAGDPPPYVDASKSELAVALAQSCVSVPLERKALVAAVRPTPEFRVEIVDPISGAHLENVFCQLRADEDRLILVALNIDPKNGVERATIRLFEPGFVEEWDCRHGDRFAIETTPTAEGGIEFETSFAASGERAYVITSELDSSLTARVAQVEVRREICTGPFEYTLDEPNVLVLDRARFRIEDGEWQDAREILKVDQAVRRAFDLPVRGGEMVQPWYRDKHASVRKPRGKVTLAFEFDVEDLPPAPLYLAMETPAAFRAVLNGNMLWTTPPPADWWVDSAFRKVPISALSLLRGPNKLILDLEFHEDINLEAVYILGEFGVHILGAHATITSLPDAIFPSDLARQGLPFYGAGITYKIPVASGAAPHERCRVALPSFEAACAKVVSGKSPGKLIAFPPHEADITDAVNAAGDRFLELEMILTRRNTFGPLHQIPLRAGAYGPGNFITEGSGFTDEYQLYPAGLLGAPELVFTRPASDF